MLDPNLVLDFQQKFKQLQIHAGMGLTEENLINIEHIVKELNTIIFGLTESTFPLKKIDEVPIKSK